MLQSTERRIEEFADDLGEILARAQDKAASWLEQRRTIAERLMNLRDTATQLLAQLGVDNATPRARSAPRTTAEARPAKAQRRKRRWKMSAEARARIAAAQRARWARQRAAKG